MLRKPNAPKNKRVMLCPKAFTKWEAYTWLRGKEPLDSKM
jgi:hypothetical protein